MNPKQFSSMLAVMISPMIVALISKALGINEIESAKRYFSSRVYVTLCDESTKVWHYSPQLLSEILLEEIKSGRIEWPEEAC